MGIWNSRPKPDHNAKAGDFDYYKLSLSYAPDFCKEHNYPQTTECNGKNSHGQSYGWVLHGLWPQYRNREYDYPETCRVATDDPTDQELFSILDEIEGELGIKWTDIAPEYGDKDTGGIYMIQHEYRKHGSCSGLSPYEYFKFALSLAQKNMDRQKSEICFSKDLSSEIPC